MSCFENKVATFLFPLFPPKTCNCPRKNIHRSNFRTVFSCFRLACDFNIANFCPFSIFVPGEIVALFLTGQGEGAIVLKIHKNRAFVGSGVNFVYLGPLQSQMLFSGVVNCKLTPSRWLKTLVVLLSLSGSLVLVSTRLVLVALLHLCGLLIFVVL